MTTNPSHRHTGILLVGAVLVLAVSILRWLLQDEPQLAAGRLPDPAELDSLRPFLEPAPPLPAWLTETQYALPSGTPRRTAGPDPWRAPPAPAEMAGTVPVEHRSWTLSAIFRGAGRAVAVIDDRQVRPGDRLPGGVRVTRIESDHVVLRGSDGTQQILRLPGQVEEP